MSCALFECGRLFFMLRLIVLPLPPGKNHLQSNNNNNNNNLRWTECKWLLTVPITMLLRELMVSWTVSGFSFSSFAAFSAHSGGSCGALLMAAASSSSNAAAVVVALAADISLSGEVGLMGNWSAVQTDKARPGNMSSAGILTPSCSTTRGSQMKAICSSKIIITDVTALLLW